MYSKCMKNTKLLHKTLVQPASCLNPRYVQCIYRKWLKFKVCKDKETLLPHGKVLLVYSDAPRQAAAFNKSHSAQGGTKVSMYPDLLKWLWNMAFCSWANGRKGTTLWHFSGWGFAHKPQGSTKPTATLWLSSSLRLSIICYSSF